MGTTCLRIYFLLFICTFLDATDLSPNNSDTTEERHPRVTGRIVKLYSGTRPDPIFCSHEGFQGDAADCTVFYRCVKGAHSKFTVFRFQCGPGTIYDPDTEVCNFPRNTRRSECGGFARLLDKGNDNEIELIRPELPHTFNSKPVYSAAIKENPTKSTAYPWATQNRFNTTVAATLSHWQNVGVNQEITATANTLRSKASRQEGDACTKDGFMGDSENCRKFYRCVGNQRGGFIRYEFSCSETTVWDDEAQSCNHPWAVQRSRCGRSNTESNNIPASTSIQSNDNQSPDSTIQQQLQINYGDKVTQTQTQISHGNVIQNQTQINYGNRENKNQTYHAKQNQTQISHGSAVSQTQTQISHGNGVQTQLQVDHTKESSQAQSQVYETSSKTSTTIESLQGQEHEMQTSTQDTGEKENSKNKCTESGFMGDTEDCKRFYRCVDNGNGGFTKYEFSCGEGTVWDSSIEACNHAWAVKECGGKAPQSSAQLVSQTTTTMKTTQSYQTTSGMAAFDDNEDTGNENQNQQPETIFTTTTMQPTTSIQEESSPDGTKCTSNGFMGDPNNCKKFYRCVDNGKGSYNKYEYNCGEGTVWDPEIEACNHPWAVKACGGSTTDINKIEATTAQSVTTVSPDQTTTYASTGSIDHDSGYSQQSSELPGINTTTKHPQTPAKPTSGKDCTQEGFMGDESDCKKFYRCVDNGHGGFIKYDFTCGEGTVWDSEITSCNHPDSAKSSCSSGSSNQGQTITESLSSTEQVTQASQSTEEPKTTVKPSTSPPSVEKDCYHEGFMGDDKDCQKFYRCVDNGRGGFIKYEFTCGEGTVWDSEINGCNHPLSNSSCSASNSQTSTSGEPNHENDEIYTESTSASESSTEQSQTTSLSQRPQSTIDKCTSEGFYGDSNDCKKFYRCVDNGKGGFTKYEFTCGEGTVWDQEIQGCNHAPSDSNCFRESENSQLQTESTQDSNPTTASLEEGKQPTNRPQSTSNSSGTCISEGFYANPNDCRKFYRCVDNGNNGGFTKYDFSCGEGTIWVQEIQSCDHDDNKSCNKPSASSTSTESMSEQQATTLSSSTAAVQQPETQEDETPNDTSNDLPTSDSSNNNEKCSSEGFYPNKNDCKKFYRCIDNGKEGFTKYDFTCGEGTAWDASIQSCNHINEVKSCQTNGQNQDNQMQDEEVTQSSGGATQTSTSGPTTESLKPANKDFCEQDGYYGNSQDCKKFYRCVDDGTGGLTKYDFTCGEGTIWDQDITACNHPRDVTNPSCQQSDNSDSSSSSSTTGTTASSASEASSTTQRNDNSSDCSQGTTKKPANKNVNCTKAGYYPDPDDCKKFYRCVDWDGEGKRFSVYHFECGEGTIWDPALDTCNHEDSVYPPRDCSEGTQSQGENVDQESPTTESTTTTIDSATTQQSTTVQTTTQESTTSENTVENSTTSEQTTTQQTTTSELTTTQHSTTSEHTTTQEATTEGQTTMQQTTTQQPTEQTTTQKTTTSEQTTSEQTTTEKTTTQESTTLESTTQELTTQASTTQKSTTQQTDTTEKTTENNQQSTTEESITEGSTEQSTTSSTDGTEITESTTSTISQDNSSYTTEGGQETTTESSSSDKCPDTEDDQKLFVCPTSFKRHPKYCNMFYQCTEDDDTHDVQIASFHCPNETIYDEIKTKCVKEKEADKKCDGELAQKRSLNRLEKVYKEPIIITNERLKCPSSGHFPFEKNQCSPGFLKCQTTEEGKLRGYVYQCPPEHVYWPVSRRCERKSDVRDCKKSHNDWTGRWDIPIERRNVAP